MPVEKDRKVKIAASLLAADFTRLGEQIAQAEAAGASWIHIDVMDGRFVPNITMGPLVVEAARRVTSLPLDVHLMIVEPERYVEHFAEAGADTISVHIEASPNLHQTLQRIKAAGCGAGVAINPHTPALLLREVLPMLDLINVMTVNPGFGGQAFLPEMMSKIAQLHAMVADIKKAIDIEVDGGINADTAPSVVQAGANVLVVGTALFQAEAGMEAAVAALRQSWE